MKPEDLTGRVIAHYKILKRLGEGVIGGKYENQTQNLGLAGGAHRPFLPAGFRNFWGERGSDYVMDIGERSNP